MIPIVSFIIPIVSAGISFKSSDPSNNEGNINENGAGVIYEEIPHAAVPTNVSDSMAVSGNVAYGSNPNRFNGANIRVIEKSRRTQNMKSVDEM